MGDTRSISAAGVRLRPGWLGGWLTGATLFVLPCVLLILAVTIFPSLWAFGLSFFRWDLQVEDHSFIGLGNYLAVLTDPLTWNAVRFTLTMAVLTVVVDLVAGMTLALTLAEELPGKRLFMAIFLLPIMVSPVVAGYGWRMLFDTRLGAINHLISLVRGEPTFIPWLNDPTLALIAVLCVNVWQSTPFMFMILLAGLSAVEPDLYEAAGIDGANAWQRFWRITIPVIRPVLLVAVLFRVIGALNMFGEVFVITQGGPGTSTQTIAWHIFQQGFRNFRWGYTAAASFLFLAGAALLVGLLLQRVRET
ncbi:MAG: sugar ABC transporter permease [Chloroflexi bacterium]|nr:sugar ABC transporter permease [Chloroflexota bacterium]